MTLLATLARAALFAYPPEFRAQFGEQIVADVEHDPSHAFAQLFDLVKGAISMHVDGVARDVAYALRRLRAAPLFVALVVLTFALGIGANVAIFSVLNAVVLRPLPFSHASSLAFLRIAQAHQQPAWASSIADASDIQSRSRSIAAISSTRMHRATLLLRGKPHTLDGLDVTPNYLSMLGVEPVLGRGFVSADGAPGSKNVVISSELWHKRFNADPSLVGSTIDLGGTRARVVGILAAGQLLPAATGGVDLSSQDFLEAMPATPSPHGRGDRSGGAIVRLAPGTSIRQANAELALVSQRLQKLYPHEDAKSVFSLSPLRTALLGAASSALWIVFAAVTGVLLVACANVGNLLSAQWSSRDRELAVRRALGASLTGIAKQLLIETAILAALGAAVGIGLAYAALRFIEPLVADALPRAASVSVDAASLAYAIGLVAIATLFAGLFPLFGVRSDDVQTALKSAGRGGDTSRRSTLRSSLVVVEVALALALVVLFGLTIRNFIATIDTPLGIRPDGVVVSDPVTLSADSSFQDLGRRNGIALQRSRSAKEADLLEHLRALPGVRSAALAFTVPLYPLFMSAPNPVVGRRYAPGQEPLASMNVVSPGYFDTLGIPLIRGRDFNRHDTMASAPVAIVNEAYADRYLRGTNPIGARLRSPLLDKRPATIVGVSANERDSWDRPAGAKVYQPASQAPIPFITAVVYAPGVSPGTIGHEIEGVFAKTQPLVQPPDTGTMAQLAEHESRSARFACTLLGTLALIALLLALAGIFGVVSFSVKQRTREFGIRMALGATTADVVGDVLRRSLAITAIGVTVGLGLAALCARAIAAQLTSVSPFDPLTFAAVIALIFACAALASLHPALRATRVQPAEALRYE